MRVVQSPRIVLAYHAYHNNNQGHSHTAKTSRAPNQGLCLNARLRIDLLPSLFLKASASLGQWNRSTKTCSDSPESKYHAVYYEVYSPREILYFLYPCSIYNSSSTAYDTSAAVISPVYLSLSVAVVNSAQILASFQQLFLPRLPLPLGVAILVAQRRHSQRVVHLQHSVCISSTLWFVGEKTSWVILPAFLSM